MVKFNSGKPAVLGVLTRHSSTDAVRFVQVAAGQLILTRSARCHYGGPARHGDVLRLVFTRGDHTGGCCGIVDEYEVLDPPPFELRPIIDFSRRPWPDVKVKCTARFLKNDKGVAVLSSENLGFIYDDKKVLEGLATNSNYVVVVRCVPNHSSDPSEPKRPPYWQLELVEHEGNLEMTGPFLAFCPQLGTLWSQSFKRMCPLKLNMEAELAGKWISYWVSTLDGSYQRLQEVHDLTPLMTEDGELMVGLKCEVTGGMEEGVPILLHHLVGEVLDHTGDLSHRGEDRRMVWCTLEARETGEVWVARRKRIRLDNEDGWHLEREKEWVLERNRLLEHYRRKAERALRHGDEHQGPRSPLPVSPPITPAAPPPLTPPCQDQWTVKLQRPVPPGRSIQSHPTHTVSPTVSNELQQRAPSGPGEPNIIREVIMCRGGGNEAYKWQPTRFPASETYGRWRESVSLQQGNYDSAVRQARGNNQRTDHYENHRHRGYSESVEEGSARLYKDSVDRPPPPVVGQASPSAQRLVSVVRHLLKDKVVKDMMRQKHPNDYRDLLEMLTRISPH